MVMVAFLAGGCAGTQSDVQSYRQAGTAWPLDSLAYLYTDPVAQPAIEKLQLSLKNTVSKRRQHAAEDAAPKKTTRRKRARHEKAAEVA